MNGNNNVESDSLTPSPVELEVATGASESTSKIPVSLAAPGHSSRKSITDIDPALFPFGDAAVDAL